MNFPTGIYQGKAGREYLAIYNFQHDVYTKPSSEIDGERLAHYSYSKGGRKGGVDIFLLNQSSEEIISYVKINKYISKQEKSFNLYDIKSEENFYLGSDFLRYASGLYDIKGEMINIPKVIREEVHEFIRADIMYFCWNDVAKKNRERSTIKIVDRIIPQTKLNFINPWRVLRGGKQSFVPQCKIEANIDFGQGCITGWIPGENPKFDGEYFTDYFSSPWLECDYCYAKDKHRNYPKTIYKFDKERLFEELKGGAQLNFENDDTLGRPVDVLRFGKRTESWSPFFPEYFIQTLEAMIQTGTRGIIPTKALPFEQEIAELLKKTDSSLIYSTELEGFEKGAASYGWTEEYKNEQAIKYAEVGVKTSRYFTIPAHRNIEKEDEEFIRKSLKNGIKIQLLPLRFGSKDIVKKITELDWDYLKNPNPNQMKIEITDPENMFMDSYVYFEGNLVVKKIHEDWLNLIKDNRGDIRMCHHQDKTYCGGCFQSKGSISKTVEVEKLKKKSI